MPQYDYVPDYLIRDDPFYWMHLLAAIGAFTLLCLAVKAIELLWQARPQAARLHQEEVRRRLVEAEERFRDAVEHRIRDAEPRLREQVRKLMFE